MSEQYPVSSASCYVNDEPNRFSETHTEFTAHDEDKHESSEMQFQEPQANDRQNEIDNKITYEPENPKLFKKESIYQENVNLILHFWKKSYAIAQVRRRMNYQKQLHN